MNCTNNETRIYVPPSTIQPAVSTRKPVHHAAKLKHSVRPYTICNNGKSVGFYRKFLSFKHCFFNWPNFSELIDMVLLRILMVDCQRTERFEFVWYSHGKDFSYKASTLKCLEYNAES
jgi:hypothetical protein